MKIPSKNSIVWAGYFWLELFCAWAVFCLPLTSSPGPGDILFCRLIVHIACDLTSHCWNQFALSDTNHHARRVFILSQYYSLLIYLWGKWKQGCAEEFQSWTHWFISRERKGKKMTCFPSVDWSLTVRSKFCFTFRLNAPFPAAAWWLPQRGFWSAWWEGWLHFLLIHFPLASELCRGLEDKCW